MFSTAVSLTAAEVGRWVVLGSFGLRFLPSVSGVCFLCCFKFAFFFNLGGGSLCFPRPGFTRGKTAPGGGSGSSSLPPQTLPACSLHVVTRAAYHVDKHAELRHPGPT